MDEGQIFNTYRQSCNQSIIFSFKIILFCFASCWSDDSNTAS
uniref:Uncharacterized protein n=1 Tax=Anguilla anguilla TaxID=7936 RepID=A0A0E9U1N4_ANGAN